MSKGPEVFTTNGTYPWSFVTQIFHNGQPSHRKTFEVMTSTYLRGSLGSVASLLAVTLYQGNPDRHHKLWNIVSTQRYILTRLTRRVSLVEQELLSLPEHLSSSPDFSGVRVTRSLVLYVCFVDRCLSFCTFSFGHCRNIVSTQRYILHMQVLLECCYI
jgi:hypothetical protein